MDLEQWIGRYRRLKSELAVAYAETPSPTGRIDRLTLEIGQAEQQIAALGGVLPASAPLPRPRAAGARRADAHRGAGPSGASSGRPAPIVRHRLTPFGQRFADSSFD